MHTRTTLLAALLFAGASQAALAQDHDQGGDRPQFQERHGGGGGEGHRWNGGGPQSGPQGAPQAAPQAQPRAPMDGHARFGAPPPAAGPVAQPQAQPGPRVGRDGGERRWEGRGERNGFAPGGTAGGDRRWDRNEAPREVVPPVGNAERGWDRQHDGHAPDPRRLDRRVDPRWDGRNDGRRDGAWDRDRRGPPANWQRWERNRFPPVYSSSRRFHVGGYHRPYGWFVRSWAFGDFLPRGWYGQDYWIDDFYDYDLPYPPPGMHWVRVGDDALLVDDYTGRIVQVVREIFW